MITAALRAAKLAFAVPGTVLLAFMAGGPALAATGCAPSEIGTPVRFDAAAVGPGASRIAVTVTARPGAESRTILLASLLLPDAANPADRSALQAALDDWRGHSVLLVEADRRADRHGRRIADLKRPGGGSLAVPLLESGLALLDGRSLACGDVAAAERRARLARRGLWSGSLVMSAVGQVPRERPSPAFVVAKGRVFSIGKAGRTTYLNFGRNFAMDMTIRIGEDIAEDLRAGGTDPDDLAGRTVLVRGFATPTDGLDLLLASSGGLELME